jgi:hypothetical protein
MNSCAHTTNIIVELSVTVFEFQITWDLGFRDIGQILK